MLHKLRNRAGDEKGFTLIELLVVILIIGILAAIAIPSFLNQRDKANDSDAKSTARAAQTAMETYLTDSASQDYTGATAPALVDIESSLNDANNLVVTVTDAGAGYTVTETSEPTDNTFTIRRLANGRIQRSCATAGDGGCNASGSW